MEKKLDTKLNIDGYIFKKPNLKELTITFPSIDFGSLKNAHICNAFGKPAIGRSVFQKLNQRTKINSVVAGDDGCISFGDQRTYQRRSNRGESIPRRVGNLTENEPNSECILGNGSGTFVLADFPNLIFNKCNHHFTGQNAYTKRLETDSSCLQRWRNPIDKPNIVVSQLDDMDSIMSFFLTFGSIKNSLRDDQKAVLYKLVVAISDMDKTMGQGSNGEIPSIYWYFYSQMQKLIKQKASPESFMHKILELIANPNFEQDASSYLETTDELITSEQFDQIPKKEFISGDARIMILERKYTQIPNFRIMALAKNFTHCFYIYPDNKGVSWFCKADSKNVAIAQSILERLDSQFNYKIFGAGSIGGGNKQDKTKSNMSLNRLHWRIKSGFGKSVSYRP